MSGTSRKHTPEQLDDLKHETEREATTRRGVFDAGDSNAGQADRAARLRAARQPEREILLPDLGTPSHGVWEEALSDAFHAGLKGFVGSVPKEGGGLDELGDAGVKFASEAAVSLLESGLEGIGGPSGLVDLAKEYPVPAAVLIGAAGYGASVWIDGKPKLKLKVKLSPISDRITAEGSHDLKTDESKFMLRFKYEW